MSFNCTPCKCDNTLSNTGFACTPIGKVAKKLLAMPLYANDGTKNGILFSSTINQAFFTALINETDASKRLYPLPTLKDVENKRGDNKTKTFKDDSTVFMREGIKSFTGLITPLDGLGAVSPQLKKALDSIRCVQMGFFIVDIGNNLRGRISDDGLSLEPIQVDEQSLNAMFMDATDDEPEMIQLKFNWNPLEKDGDLRMIVCAELGGVNLLALRALLNVCSIVTDIAEDGFVAKLYTDYGTPINPILAKGLVAADFALYNKTTEADVTIDDVTESPDGTYTFEFTAQNAGDELELTPTQAGKDFTCVVENIIHIPLT